MRVQGMRKAGRVAAVCVLSLTSLSVPSAAQSAPQAGARLAPGFVRIPGGTFMMGSPADEVGRENDEGPVRQVTVRPFAMSVTEVTRAEFKRFVTTTGYVTDAELSISGCGPKPESGPLRTWRNPGYEQTDEHPVVCVSRNDAMRYAAWLSRQVGIPLRLPTEAEFENAIRAGGQTLYPWGTDGNQGCTHGNIGDVKWRQFRPASQFTGTCDDGYTYTAPVGHYEANKYGLKDSSGNVWEWAQDCYHENFEGAPTDGSAWTTGTCELGVLRGASFDDGPRFERSANRVRSAPGRGAWVFGIRLAHDQ